jgi:predicted transposase YbfD/YdcC
MRERLGLPNYDPNRADDKMISLIKAVEQLGICMRSAKSLVLRGILPATRILPGSSASFTLIHDVEWLQERYDWPGLKGVIMVGSTRKSDGKVTQETRFYITSLILLANLVGPMIRDHWMFENGLHWIMDMVFRDDECRVRTENAPVNFTTLKHRANNLIRKMPDKNPSQSLKRKTAGWDDHFLASLVAVIPSPDSPGPLTRVHFKGQGAA